MMKRVQNLLQDRKTLYLILGWAIMLFPSIYNNLPFINFGGIFKDITVINILVYEIK